MNAISPVPGKVDLAGALDRALNKGVVLSGDVTISLADVDLIFVGLKVLLASVETAGKMQWGYITAESAKVNGEKREEQGIGMSGGSYNLPRPRAAADERVRLEAVQTGIDARPERVEKGLGRLVLTLIELIRRLIEKQAVRRVEANSLSEEEIEGLGETLMKLENKMEELKGVFGLKDEDLSLNLGPLGDLM